MLRPAALLLLSSLIAGCSPSPLSERIGEEARTHSAVDLAAITSFEWDTVFIFSPYSTSKVICQTVGPLWANCESAAPRQVAESEFHLVFTNRGSFVAQVVHSRTNGEFCQSTCALRIAKPNSLFKVVPYSHRESESHFLLVSQPAP